MCPSLLPIWDTGPSFGMLDAGSCLSSSQEMRGTEPGSLEFQGR